MLAVGQSCELAAEQVRVRHQEGLVHGFLKLTTLQGTILADGDLTQNVNGDRVTTRLTFRFKDGSVHDETATYTQQGSFRLVRDHLVQTGPAFQHPVDLTLDAQTGQVAVRSTQDGKGKNITEHLELPADVANGMLFVLLKNISPDEPETEVSFVASTPKPRVVKLKIRRQGEEPFSTGGVRRRAMHYVVKVDIGGLSGVLASVAGKQPADTHVWILEGEAPAFLKSEGPLAPDGPTWRTEQVLPVWPPNPPAQSGKVK